MSWKKIAPVLVALIVGAPAYAGECDGLEGKELKKCEKDAEARSKQDERSTPFTPSALDASLAPWDGDTNPFATDAYRVRVTQTGIKSVDDYLAKAFRVQATVSFAKYLVDETGKGNADALKAIPTLVPLVEQAVNDGKALVDEGQGVVTNLPKELVGPQAMKLPKVMPALKDGVSALTSAVDQAPAIGKSLVEIAKNPGAAAGAAGQAGMDAAGEKVEDAMK